MDKTWLTVVAIAVALFAVVAHAAPPVAHVPILETEAAEALLDLRAVTDAGLSYSDFAHYLPSAVIAVDRMQRHGAVQPDLSSALAHYLASAIAWQHEIESAAAVDHEDPMYLRINVAARDKHLAEMRAELSAARDALAHYLPKT